MAEATSNGRNGRHSILPLFLGLLTLCSTAVVGLCAWLLVSMVDARERLIALRADSDALTLRLGVVEGTQRTMLVEHLPQLLSLLQVGAGCDGRAPVDPGARR